MQEIADRYGLSRERIRQILKRNGIGGGWHTRVDPLRVLSLAVECDSVKEISRRTGYWPHSISRAINALAPTLIDEIAAYRHEATRNRLIAELQDLAARLGRTPTKLDIDAAIGGANKFQVCFGSLSKAQRVAGLEVKKNWHPHLSEAQKEAIRRLYVRGSTGPNGAVYLAKRFGVTRERVTQLGKEARKRSAVA